MRRSSSSGRTGRAANQGSRVSWCIAGALVALGYWGDPVRTAERFKPAPGDRPDWRTPELAVWSGDTVVADEEGYLYFVGRRDEMIKTSGYRVSPTEVEEVAYDSGLVSDAVALGVEDARLGQRIVLLATPANGQLDPNGVDRLHAPQAAAVHGARCRSRCAASCRRSPNGKFDRNLLKAELRMSTASRHRGVLLDRRPACRRRGAAAPARGTSRLDAVLCLRSGAPRPAGGAAPQVPALCCQAQLRDEGQPDAGRRAAPGRPRRCD